LHVDGLAVEHFVGLYVFVTYLDETDFLFDRQSVSYELDFHGSFYAGIVSFGCSLLAALVVYMDESISKAHRESSKEEEDVDMRYLLPEEFVLYEPHGWNMMNDNQYNYDDDFEDEEGEYIPGQNGLDRSVLRN